LIARLELDPAPAVLETSGRIGRSIMKFVWIAAVALAALTAAPSHAAAANAYATGNVNMRAGPGVDYPRITTVQRNAAVTVYGCTRQWTWCDTEWRGYRGWVSANFLEFIHRGRRVQPDYGPRIGLPIITFEFGPYWDRHYRGRSWYRDRDRWDRDRRGRDGWDRDRRDGDRWDRRDPRPRVRLDEQGDREVAPVIPRRPPEFEGDRSDGGPRRGGSEPRVRLDQDNEGDFCPPFLARQGRC
jgi:uncharacterized protein YraI